VRPPATPSVKFTYDDFLHFPDDGKRHEIIDGEHHVTPSPNTKHQVIVGNLYLLLATYLKAHAIGAVFLAPFDVLFSDRDIVEPDLLYISRERSSVITDQHVRGAPDLIVEILSPGTRRIDEIEKRSLYETFGVNEYWVVDPELETIRIDRRVEGAFVFSGELIAGKGDELTTPLLPGFSVKLVEVFKAPFPA
jgi:Uma2 family endonuclease